MDGGKDRGAGADIPVEQQWKRHGADAKCRGGKDETARIAEKHEVAASIGGEKVGNKALRREGSQRREQPLV
jgi:hypothetical protein